MYTVRGFISASNLTGPQAVLLFMANGAIGVFLIMFVGFLLHIGWNWA